MDAQFPLDLALHVLAPGAAENSRQATLAHGDADALAGMGDDFDEKVQIALDDALGALFIDQETGERGPLYGMTPKG